MKAFTVMQGTQVSWVACSRHAIQYAGEQPWCSDQALHTMRHSNLTDHTTLASAAKQAAKKEYDFTDETLYYGGPPHRGDLAVNLVMATTLVWLPLTAAAVGRGAFVSYRFTDRRLSVKTAAPWKSECQHETAESLQAFTWIWGMGHAHLPSGEAGVCKMVTGHTQQ